ncbi:MAG: hypothetical protein HGB01_04850 [Chlorobiaceae bacterium]|nr:hypothetical protein [Chlorobiaceae bacterium]
MPENNLSTLLSALTGQIVTGSPQEEKSLEQVQETLAQALLRQDPASVRNQEFLFRRSDIYAPSSVGDARIRKLDEIVNRIRPGAASEVQVFMRTLPIRTTQVPGSATEAAAGVRVVTKGPFLDSSGQDFYFDYVRTEKLIPLYIEGWATPAILFKATFRNPKFVLANSLPVEVTKSYTVVPDSVWISARVFDPSADAAYYCGLRVKGGKITLDADPQIVNGQLTVAATTNALCELQLEQNASFASDPASPYGDDARKSGITLPIGFRFSFKGGTKQILDVAPSSWNVYGHKAGFIYKGAQNSTFFPFVNRLAIPVQCDTAEFTVSACLSTFFNVEGSAPVLGSWWCLPAAKIDITAPPEADGNGALIVSCGPGLDAATVNLRDRRISLPAPFILAEPGRIGLTELKSDGSGATMDFAMWQDEANRFGTTMEWRLPKESLFLYNTSANGFEMAVGTTACRMQVDRPVKVDGTAVTVSTKNSLWTLVAGKAKRQVALVDNDVLMDNSPAGSKIPQVRPYGLAMHNALFTVTPPNSVVLFAECEADFTSLQRGKLYLGFGLFSYLPTLPDPYAANLGMLEKQFLASRESVASVSGKRDSVVWLWLIGLVQWEQHGGNDKVGVSFHFAPLTAAFPVKKLKSAEQVPPQAGEQISYLDIAKSSPFSRIYGDPEPAPVPHTRSMMAEQTTSIVAGPGAEDFALLDVSSKANQMGVAFNFLNSRQQTLLGRQFKVDVQDESNASVFPIQVDGLDVVTKGMFAQAFTVPQVAWEPVFNLTPPETPAGDPKGAPFDPPVGFNYYQNDGFPTRVGNFSSEQVPLSPIPLAKYLVETYRHRKDGKTYALFNLPFGMFTAAVLDGKSPQTLKPTLENVRPVFENYVNGGLQLELTAGSSLVPGEDNMFEGMTVQLLNINRPNGTAHDESTLGHSGTTIFNGEFLVNQSKLPFRPASPVMKAGLSGYGASMFSDWHNRNAAFAQTSQALFNVTTGRTSHEVVQVKSMIYPWGVKVVRTYTLFRLSNGYVCRIDSGWKAESDGKFDFSYKVPVYAADGVTVDHFDEKGNPYTFHPGVVHGIFNVRNIHEQPKDYKGPNLNLVAVTFDADIQLEHVVEGGKSDRVPSRGVVGYVQLLPQGAPISVNQFVGLMQSENGSIGAEIQCTVKIAGTRQRMRLDRADVNVATDASNQPIFVAAARGSVVLPKDGSWTMVRHQRSSGEVTPVSDGLSVPLVRIGAWKKDIVVDPVAAANELVRMAFPGDLLRPPGAETVNFGFLQNMNTQKVLFLTPSFKPTVESLLSKTPPLLADAFRLMNGNAIFPNIGDAETAFGSAIQMLKGIDSRNGNPLEAFSKLAGVNDLGSEVRELMELNVKEEAGKLIDQGYKLIKNKANDLVNEAFRFDLPNFEYPLVDVTGLKIYVEYKATKKAEGAPKDYVGKFDFDVDSFAADMAKTWKGRLSSMQMVVDLGPLKRLLTIKGNFNSQKSASTDFGSASPASSGIELPTPEIEYSEDLKPVIEILEILAALSTGDYAAVLSKGLKIAMSNSANIWEYKFEATKDIPLVKFPPGAAYDAPQTPLKLEASLGLGVFFNAALKVTTDPKQLLPTAGAYFKFHGGLQVMCFSVGAGAVYAVGNADLVLRADTSPLISLDMKFGFGAQVGVGLPVIGNVSILFMVGVEIYVDSNQTVAVTAFMLFRGHAEILGGLIGVTITIEAKGTIEKGGPGLPTNCRAQVTFGLDISIFLVINISFSETWEETRQIA